MKTTEPFAVEDHRRAHAVLHEDLHRLEDVAHPTARHDAALLRVRLGITQAHLVEHFRFEEHNGYMDAVRKREPRLERTVELLADEHRQLAQSLAELIEEAEAATGVGDALRDGIRGWVQRVRRHEALENDVVQDAFTLDIGAED
jgi:hypothetical protein